MSNSCEQLTPELFTTEKQVPKKTRGRKSSITRDLDQNIVLQQHHFKYSDAFAEMLANFATAHLETRNKEFKAAWKEWIGTNATLIEREVAIMKTAGYQGSVEEKMYFSARYYYRKKAIREQTEPPEDQKSPRKKYECIDKDILVQMNEHIISQINYRESANNPEVTNDDCNVSNGSIISNMRPSTAFTHYCEKYGFDCQDAHIKKTYKNLYWRISKKTK